MSYQICENQKYMLLIYLFLDRSMIDLKFLKNINYINNIQFFLIINYYLKEK